MNVSVQFVQLVLVLASAIVALVLVLVLTAALREVGCRYVDSAVTLRRRQFRADDWAPYEPINITETVATVVAAAVAVRYIKEKKDAVTEKLDFRKLRRIVRRMTASIRSGEARSLRDKRIVWIHSEDAEDEFERQVLLSLGAKVTYYWCNDDLLQEIDRSIEGKSDPIDLIVTNKWHYVDESHLATNQKDVTAGEQLISALQHKKRLRAPIVVYSRSLVDHDEQRYKQLGAEYCVAFPEEFIHAILTATNSSTTTRGDDGVRHRRTNVDGKRTLVGTTPTKQSP